MKIINDIRFISIDQWKELIESSDTKSIFQTKEWYEFCLTQRFLKPFVFSIENDKGFLKGIIVGYIQKDGGKLKQFFSRRAIINGGPLLANDIKEEELDLLLKFTIQELKKKAIYIETRNLSDYSQYKEVFSMNNFQYEAHLDFLVDTRSEETVQANIHKSKKRKIKSTIKEDIFINQTPSVEEVKSYYKLLNNLYAKKVKTPLFPMSFFLDLYNQPFARFLLIMKNEEILGGQVILCLERKVTYLFYLCGEDGKIKGVFPSVLGTYAGIKYAVDNGCAICDMMGAGKPNEEYGVRDFKAEFGGKLVEYGRFLNITNPFLYRIGALGVKIMKLRK